MSKLIVSANSEKHLMELLKKDIDGIILSIDNLSVNDSYYVDVDFLEIVDFKNKEVFVSLNKLMHNDDLELLRIVMNKLKSKNVKILFYDMAVYSIAKELDMVDKLVIYQDHLNASNLSNNFYYSLGIRNSFITSDITCDELLDIKNQSCMSIMFLVYGYAPIFYSRRYLVSNYLKHIKDNKKAKKYTIISDTDVEYPISEEKFGTTIYTSREINLINFLDRIKSVDYIVMRSNMIDDDSFNSMVDKFINHDNMDGCYIGFFDTKTIYRVK